MSGLQYFVTAFTVNTGFFILRTCSSVGIDRWFAYLSHARSFVTYFCSEGSIRYADCPQI